MARYVQYGCGWSAPEGWENYDASLTLRWERLPRVGRYTKNAQRFPAHVRPGDIVKGLPVPDGSCPGVYASHVLEHLTLADFHQALRNTHRMLEKSGIFRMVVPDLEWCALDYLARIGRGEADGNSAFLRSASMGVEHRQKGPMGLARRLFNTSEHLWMSDELSLRAALEKHGFEQIRRCRFGDCEDPMFERVEDAGRFENAVAIESRRR